MYPLGLINSFLISYSGNFAAALAHQTKHDVVGKGNDRGPRIEPCGTPRKSVIVCSTLFFIFTLFRNVEADVAIRSTTAVFTYCRSRGLFAGISLEGSGLIERKETNRKYGPLTTTPSLEVLSK